MLESRGWTGQRVGKMRKAGTHGSGTLAKIAALLVSNEALATTTDTPESSPFDPVVLEFVSSLVDTLIWPIVVLVLIFSFRGQIKKLFGRITSISVRGTQIAFGEGLDAAKEQAKSAGLQVESESARDDAWPDREPNRDYPRASVIEAWLAVEKGLRDASIRLDLARPGELRAVNEATRRLRRAGHVNEDLGGVLRRLRHLRNEAAHDIRFDISADQAEDYLVLCFEVISYLESLGPGT